MKAPKPLSLERVRAIVGEAIMRAPLFYIDAYSLPAPVKSVAVHTDHDGTISVVLAGKVMENRIVDPEAKKVQAALDGWRKACEVVPELKTEPPDEVLYSDDLLGDLLADAGVSIEPDEDVFEAVARNLRAAREPEPEPEPAAKPDDNDEDAPGDAP